MKAKRRAPRPRNSRALSEGAGGSRDSGLALFLGAAAALLLFWKREAIVDTVTGNLVRNRSKADGVHPDLLEALDQYEADPALDAAGNPIPISIGSGVRTDAEQLVLYWMGRAADGTIIDETKHATNAKTTAQTSHGVRSGYGDAYDFDPIPATRANYVAVGQWYKDRGFEWGGDWTAAFPPNKDNPYGGDQRHINIKGWQSIPI